MGMGPYTIYRGGLGRGNIRAGIPEKNQHWPWHGDFHSPKKIDPRVSEGLREDLAKGPT